ncbi:MAG: serine hydrolase [Candidatus Hydrogenedentota bacterium]
MRGIIFYILLASVPIYYSILSLSCNNSIIADPSSPFSEISTISKYDIKEESNTANLRPFSVPELDLPSFPGTQSKKIDWNSAETRIKKIITKYKKARIGLVVKDLNTGYTIKHNADASFASASLVKIPIAITLFNEIANGTIPPNITPLYEEKHRAGGSGVLRTEKAGQKIHLQDLVYLMLAKSDNTATNILTDFIGMDKINKICKKYGWNNTNIVRQVMDLKERKNGVENWTTARDMASMLEALYNGKVVSRNTSNIILRFMLNPPIDDRLPRKLPSSIDVIHKTGLIYDNAHDVGILYLPGNQPVIVSALVDNIRSDYRYAKYLIANIARIIYEESVPKSV